MAYRISNRRHVPEGKGSLAEGLAAMGRMYPVIGFEGECAGVPRRQENVIYSDLKTA